MTTLSAAAPIVPVHPFLLQPSLPGTGETIAGAVTAAVVEEAGAATMLVFAYLFFTFQNGFHALERKVVCNVLP